MRTDANRVIIIGAGIGGLAAALRLAHAGYDVTVIEAHSDVGGKMRTHPSIAGPVDAGPTVLTMRHVFEDLFTDVGLRLSDHVTLQPLATLARHYWSDGTMLDLMADAEASAENIAAAFGDKARQEFQAFSARAARLYQAFEEPMMLTPEPKQSDLTARVLRQPRLISDMAPHQTLARMLRSSFRDPRLAQLFGRYATYVGGSPFASPAILSLIWNAESQGVWSVQGGMHYLARTLMKLARSKGATFQYDTPVARITKQNGRVTGVDTAAGHIAADLVVFNGDPRALQRGLLGDAVQPAVAESTVMPRSLSAYVHAFAAKPSGTALAHHTVFFADSEAAEFDALTSGDMPTDATLYLCAQDHGAAKPTDPQRFEIIMNAPPLRDKIVGKDQCQTLIFNRLRDFGLTFDATPDLDSLTMPQDFDKMFPASQGSLYGRSPQGMTSALKRPTARTPIPGLYLCGGGAHPGAGIPMATLSARHAVAAIMQDQILTSTSRPMAMRGGMSTGSATAAQKQFRS